MTWWGIFGFSLIFLAVGVTRVRAEFGPPSHEILGLDPARLMTTIFGSRLVGTGNLTIISFYYWLNRLNVSHPMPNQLEAFKIAERTRINCQHLIWVMMLSMHSRNTGIVLGFSPLDVQSRSAVSSRLHHWHRK